MEPALLKVLMSHEVTANADMSCPIRTGQRRIEYNPALCLEMNDCAFEEMMKAECIRILLKHPYERQPEKCPPFAVTMGSNCVIADNYRMKQIVLTTPKEIGLEGGQHFEYYAREIAQRHEPSADEEPLGQQSALWAEDAMAAAEINEMIGNISQWGSLAGNMAGVIIASSKVKIDYRRVLQAFRSDIMSSKRRLTRMKPNRRFGFQNLGSVYQMTVRLLVAIDVSGSTTDEMVGDFFGIINRFFRYGIEEIDVVQFDATLQGEPITMRKAQRATIEITGRGGTIEITGRGGTNYQPIFDHAATSRGRYQGVIIFTDGCGPEPVMPDYFMTPVLWVLPADAKAAEWLSQYGRVAITPQRNCGEQWQ